MNYWYKSLLKLKYVIACLVIAAGFAVTPHLVRMAYAERGYEAIGGEYAPLVLSFVISVTIIQVFSDLEARYRHKEREKRREGGHGQYADKMQKVRKNSERPEFNRNWIRKGLRIQIERTSYTLVTHSETAPEEIETKYRSYAITIIRRKCQ